VQPMSDVPAAALWLAALTACARGDRRDVPGDASAKAGQMVGGVCASLAVLTRPNLAVAVLPLLALLPDRRAWLRFSLAALPGMVVLASLNAVRYGSPLVSGYSDTGTLFSQAHVLANLRRYPRWLFETETPFLLLALLMPWRVRRDRARLAAVAAIAAVLIALTYLAYTVFDDWWYIRFLLPVLPVLIVFSVAGTLGMVSRLAPHAWLSSSASKAILAASVAIPLSAWYIHASRARQVFALQALESRFVLAGEYAARHLPANAVVLAVQESGSVRYHGGRPALAWDAIPAGALDNTITALARRGDVVYVALEDWEEPRFRGRFAGQRFGGLDWPPAVEISGRVKVRFFDVRGIGRASR